MSLRLAIASDLHVEKGAWQPPALDVDLWILAGDIGWGLEGIAWVARHLNGRPAIYVAGNREYWKHPPGTGPIRALRKAAAAVPGLIFLQDEAHELDIRGIRLRLLGATLWTDYALEGDPGAAMVRAGAAMPDYQNGQDEAGTTLTPAAVLGASHASAAFFQQELSKPRGNPVIAITHHLPSPAALKGARPGHIPTTASVTHLDALIMRSGPDLWVHGHSHWDDDFRIGPTRVLSCQRGGPEHEKFAPLIVEIGAQNGSSSLSQ